MPFPHDKCPLRVAKIALPLLLMQYRFFWNSNSASQVAFFQTQTFLHLIGSGFLQFVVFRLQLLDPSERLRQLLVFGFYAWQKYRTRTTPNRSPARQFFFSSQISTRNSISHLKICIAIYTTITRYFCSA